MKKMLTLVLVLAVASLANAMVLSISVGGDTQIQETTVAPSSNLVLDIYSNGFVNGPDSGTAFGLVVVSGPDTIGGGAVATAAPDATTILTDPELAGLFGGSGVYGQIDTFAQGTAGDKPAGTYIDQISFHCDGPGDVFVKLVTTQDWETFTVVDSLTVHQIPEPITMSLLGLGGLFLRRKK